MAFYTDLLNAINQAQSSLNALGGSRNFLQENQQQQATTPIQPQQNRFSLQGIMPDIKDLAMFPPRVFEGAVNAVQQTPQYLGNAWDATRQAPGNIRNYLTNPSFISPEPGGDIQNPWMRAIQQIQMRERLRNFVQSLTPPTRADYRGPKLMNPEEVTPWSMTPRHGAGQYYQDLQNFQNSPGYEQLLKK